MRFSTTDLMALLADRPWFALGSWLLLTAVGVAIAIGIDRLVTREDVASTGPSVVDRPGQTAPLVRHNRSVGIPLHHRVDRASRGAPLMLHPAPQMSESG